LIHAVNQDIGINTEYVSTGLELIKSGDCDIAHGSRRMKNSVIVVYKPWYRRLIPKLFRWLFIRLLGIPSSLTDTQCGFKIYRGDVARTLYKQSVLDGFLFDIEIIIRALKQGYRIREFPVEWKADLDSRLSVVRNSPGVLKEIFALRQLRKTL